MAFWLSSTFFNKNKPSSERELDYYQRNRCIPNILELLGRSLFGLLKCRAKNTKWVCSRTVISFLAVVNLPVALTKPLGKIFSSFDARKLDRPFKAGVIAGSIAAPNVILCLLVLRSLTLTCLWTGWTKYRFEQCSFLNCAHIFGVLVNHTKTGCQILHVTISWCQAELGPLAFVKI